MALKESVGDGDMPLLQAGDVLLRLNDVPIAGTEALKKELLKNQEVTQQLLIRRGQQEMSVELPANWPHLAKLIESLTTKYVLAE